MKCILLHQQMIKSRPTAELVYTTLLTTLVYAFICEHCVYIITYLAAPSQPPGNIEWNLTNSKIFLNWEHVKPMENESEVTGYKVSLSEQEQKPQNRGNK